MQQYAACFILLQNHPTCFGCLSHPSSGVLKTVAADSDTGHNIGTANSLQRDKVGTAVRVPEVAATVFSTPNDGCGRHPKHVG